MKAMDFPDSILGRQKKALFRLLMVSTEILFDKYVYERAAYMVAEPLLTPTPAAVIVESDLRCVIMRILFKKDEFVK